MALLSLSLINKIERKIRNADVFQYISSNKIEEIIESLRHISIQSGIAIYLWLPDEGLVNIKTKDTPLPATRMISEALKYAQKNHYFAVYVFPAINQKELMEVRSVLPTVFQFSKSNPNTKFLFLVNEGAEFAYLSTNGDEIELENKNSSQYKLRDSKWVLSDE